jgi:hypothetical protein
MAESVDPRAQGMRDPAFDLLVLGIGVLVTAGLGVGLATAFLHISRASTGPDVGATSATLGDAFATFLGAALGLALGSGASARVCRRGSRMATGLLVGSLAYALALVPVLVVTGPSDVSARDSLGLALFAGIPLGIAVVIASVIGAGLGSAAQRRREKRGH